MGNSNSDSHYANRNCATRHPEAFDQRDPRPAPARWQRGPVGTADDLAESYALALRSINGIRQFTLVSKALMRSIPLERALARCARPPQER
jgi:hypothetical protein